MAMELNERLLPGVDPEKGQAAGGSWKKQCQESQRKIMCQGRRPDAAVKSRKRRDCDCPKPSLFSKKNKNSSERYNIKDLIEK